MTDIRFAPPTAPNTTNAIVTDSLGQQRLTPTLRVRMAHGAQTRDVRQGMSPVIIGVGLGLICIFVIGRLITPQLYQISAPNPVLLLSVTLILCAVALISCLVPARRAALIDPIQALRIE